MNFQIILRPLVPRCLPKIINNSAATSDFVGVGANFLICVYVRQVLSAQSYCIPIAILQSNPLHSCLTIHQVFVDLHAARVCVCPQATKVISRDHYNMQMGGGPHLCIRGMCSHGRTGALPTLNHDRNTKSTRCH